MNLDPQMAAVLMFSLASFTLLFVYLLIVRVRQEDFIFRLERLRHRVLSR